MSFRHTAVSAVAAGIAVVFAVSGCGSSGGDTATPMTGSAAKEAPAGGPLDAQKQQDNAGAAPVKAPENLKVETRAIIYNGGITVRVSKVDDAAARAAAFATGAGGFVGGEERRSDDRRSEARLVLRVPSDKFGSVLADLENLGDEQTRSVSTQDVTEQLVDVDTRIANAQASVDRIRALLARAQTIGEITSLESELSRREADLESLKARKRKLDGLTALSTINATLLGPEAEIDKDDNGFLAGLASGWSAFTASAAVAVTVVGWLLPWALVLGVPLWLLVVLLRRVRRSRPASAPLMPPFAYGAGIGMPPAGPVAGPPHAHRATAPDEPAQSRPGATSASSPVPLTGQPLPDTGEDGSRPDPGDVEPPEGTRPTG